MELDVRKNCVVYRRENPIWEFGIVEKKWDGNL